MIVSEKNISDALAYLAIDPHPLALSRKYVVDAENACKEMYAKVFLQSSGTVKERESEAETNRNYVELKEEEADAILELERHKARARAAEMLIEVWRSENANTRAAERVR
jgi:hypothetical protein